MIVLLPVSGTVLLGLLVGAVMVCVLFTLGTFLLGIATYIIKFWYLVRGWVLPPATLARLRAAESHAQARNKLSRNGRPVGFAGFVQHLRQLP